MRRLAILAVAVLFAACGEVPTQNMGEDLNDQARTGDSDVLGDFLVVPPTARSEALGTTSINGYGPSIPLPGYDRTFASQLTRGFWFQAPVDFVITGLRVPDETGQGVQNVEVYKLPAVPPLFPTGGTGGQVFYAAGVPGNDVIPASISFQAGDYVGVLGATGTDVMHNSYSVSAVSFPSQIGGQPIQLQRFLTQTNLFLSGGNQTYFREGGGPIGRVEIYTDRRVTIDIKPGSDPNTINIDADKSMVTVALLSTDDFDATTVDHTTLLFEGVPEEHVDRKTGEAIRHEEDVNGDGDMDLLMHVRVGDVGFDQSSTEGTLTGETFDGIPIRGTDAVVPIWQVAHVSGGGIMNWSEELVVNYGDEQYGFNAKMFSDGSVQGQLQTNWEETTPGTAFHMELNCLEVDGNQAYVGGHVTSVSPDAIYSVGEELAFWVEDNGEGADADPDRISFFHWGNCEAPGTQADIQFWVLANVTASQTAGNIQVKGN